MMKMMPVLLFMKPGLHIIKKAFTRIADMGEYWEKLTGLPIPLGAIVIKKNIPEDIAIESEPDYKKKS